MEAASLRLFLAEHRYRIEKQITGPEPFGSWRAALFPRQIERPAQLLCKARPILEVRCDFARQDLWRLTALAQQPFANRVEIIRIGPPGLRPIRTHRRVVKGCDQRVPARKPALPRNSSPQEQR